MEDAARQLLRALRGPRSQVAFSRLLGYRSNVAADWEAGRRAPTVHQMLVAAGRVGVDVPKAFAEFHPSVEAPCEPGDPKALATWLHGVAGHTRITELAKRASFSRFQVSRWLSGAAKPRLPEFLTLLDAMTGRAADFVAAIVDIERVPALAPVYRRMWAARRLAFDVPWTSALLPLLETTAYAGDVGDAWLARQLGVPVEEVARALTALQDAEIISKHGDRYVVTGAMSVDVRATSADVRGFKAHWSGVVADRVARFPEQARVSVNLFAVSRADMERIKLLQQEFYREMRGIVASSEPSETVGMALMYLGAFEAS